MALTTQDSYHVVKGLFDIDAVLGRRLDKLASEFPGQSVAFLGGHLALRHSVALVTDEHDGDGQLRVGGGDGGAGIRRRRGARFLDTLYLVMEAFDARKGRARGNAVYEDKALAVTDPLVAQRRVFFLAGRVEDFEHARLAVYDDLLAVLVFNCWVVLDPQAKPVSSCPIMQVFWAGIGDFVAGVEGEERGRRERRGTGAQRPKAGRGRQRVARQ